MVETVTERIKYGVFTDGVMQNFLLPFYCFLKNKREREREKTCGFIAASKKYTTPCEDLTLKRSINKHTRRLWFVA